MKPLTNKFIIISLFGVAMAFLESAVVVYLREIMYPEGFDFPLAPIHPHLALTEILREAATVIMLLSIGFLAAKTFSARFAWFMYSFAVWDIFYYVFLYLLLGWPESVMTWDVLFLIPATWTGPVLTPLIITVLLIAFSVIILVFSEKGINTKIRGVEWGGLILGSLVVIVAFITDYMRHILSKFTFGEAFSVKDPALLSHAQAYVPDTFPWFLFSMGVLIIGGSIGLYYNRIRG